MKRYARTLLSLGILCSAAAATAQTARLSPFTRFFLRDQLALPQVLPAGYAYRQAADGQVYLKAMLQTNTAIDESALKALGVRTHTRAASVRTVEIPVNALPALRTLSGVSYIALDEPMVHNMDVARRLTRTDSVHHGEAPLPMPFTGKGVVMGILDAGFDYNHPTLKDTTGQRFRITRLWEQKSTGTAPTGYSYGHELTDSLLIKADGYDRPDFSHGTHVAGIAAGSGYGSAGGTFRGIAFESELMIVGITPDSTQWINTGVSDIVDGMNYVFSEAAKNSSPAVVNLSWGTTLGPHDGTSLFSQACDALTGPGKLFVCSAGNNGSNNLHLTKAFTAADTVVKTVMMLDATVNKTWLDVWGDTAQKFCLEVTLYNGAVAGSSSGMICLDNALHEFRLVGSDGDTCFVDVVTDSATFNDKPRMFFRFSKETSDNICLTIRAKSGAVDMWCALVANAIGYYGAFVRGGIPDAVSGDNDMTTGDVADTRSAIAVGSYASRTRYTDINGLPVDYRTYAIEGALAPYSSRGPAADGRIKPDITAPGLFIASGVSSYDTAYTPTGTASGYVVAGFTDPVDGQEDYYAMMTGTSMAAPVVAGIVALMLQANPELDPAKTIDILAETAIEDTYTRKLPAAGNKFWGHGKVNAFGAVNRALAALGTSSQAGIPPLDCLLYPNPTDGHFTLLYTGTLAEQLQLELFDITGKRLSAENWSVVPGRNTFSRTGTLAPGVYFARISSPSRGNITIRALVH